MTFRLGVASTCRLNFCTLLILVSVLGVLRFFYKFYLPHNVVPSNLNELLNMRHLLDGKY